MTTRERAADAVVHVLGLGLGVPAAITVVVLAAVFGSISDVATAAIYASGMVAMFACSAAYNMLHRHRWREWLQRFDHAAIFGMIASSYTPFTRLLESGWAIGLTASVWGIAGAGMAGKLWRPRGGGRLRRTLSVALYLGLGWIGVIAIKPLMTSLAWHTLLLIGIGGAIYSAGVIFHLWHRLPYQNAIWHGFVLAAAGVHYAAVLTTLVG
ncbi:MAG: hemolysin III family protein [Alphaproteobacteria bacterium]|nr:hemolysin III family protein [Alphaproteobacteria bacterium]MBV8412602.1 hemolysin III family protein [Alphaproteobacteria bacterium]